MPPLAVRLMRRSSYRPRGLQDLVDRGLRLPDFAQSALIHRGHAALARDLLDVGVRGAGGDQAVDVRIDGEDLRHRGAPREAGLVAPDAALGLPDVGRAGGAARPGPELLAEFLGPEGAAVMRTRAVRAEPAD